MNSLKIYLLLAFALFVKATAVFGQNVFQQRSKLDSIVFMGYRSISVSDTGFFTIGTGSSIIMQNDTPKISFLRNYFSWYNWQGDLVKNKIFYRDTANLYAMWYSTNTFTDSCFYFYGGISDLLNSTENNSDIYARKINWNGDTIWTKRYDSGWGDLGYACLPLNDGLIGIGASNFNSNMRQRIIRYDASGNIVWNKTYNQTAGESYARYIKADLEGNFYIAGWARPSGGPFQENARIRILKINEEGDIIWNKIMPGICDEYDCPIDIAQDGNLLLAKFDCYMQNGNAIDSKVSLYKINQFNGDTLWKKDYLNYSVKSIARPFFLRQLSNGDILMGGTNLKIYIEQEDTLFGNYVGELICTDENGNLKWQRYYSYYEGEVGENDACFLTDVKQTPDGGLIMVGETTGENWQDGWIIKTDANGCIDMSCVNGVEELDDDDFRLYVYPNPAQDYVSLDLPITHTKATLQIYTLQGQLVTTEDINGGGLQNFSLTHLPKGVYQLIVSASNGKLLGREKLVVVR